jgi:endonuclease YncB( thermonuclease family)
MKMSARQQKALFQLFTAKSGATRLTAAAVLLIAAFTWWQQGQVVPGKMVKGGVLQGQVVRVADGDTVTLIDQQQNEYKLRLAYIDAPEKAMPYGDEAKRHLTQLLQQQTVEAHIDDVDNYGRGVARIVKDGQDVNYAQIARGYAWHYQQYARKTQDGAAFERYAKAQGQAQQKHIGLWQEGNPTPPWQWRQAQR